MNESQRPGYAPLVKDFSEFFTRRLYTRSRDCWNRPISGIAGPQFQVLERVSDDYNKTFRLTGRKVEAVNFCSYNYLGFAELTSSCQGDSIRALERYGASTCAPSLSLGYTQVHRELEETTAEFVGKEAAMVFGMGFATNSLGLPALMGKGSLIISDALNHTSIVVGARSSGAKIRVFKHNSPQDLEAVIREAIAEGQPRTHRPWTKIMIVIEGIYSMEGETSSLAEIIAIKKRYKCYLYLDEAHSIGALGRTGRGVVEALGCDTRDVDIMMGTFTKSFGSVGGYIAGDRALINYLRLNSAGTVYADAISVVCAQQALSALRVIMGKDGTTTGVRKIKALRDNSDYMRHRLMEMGFEVLGNEGSPVIPFLIYNPAKISAVSRLCLERGLAIVVVGFPATSVIESRCRLCVSAAHTREDIDFALKVLDEVGDRVGLKYKAPHNKVVPMNRVKRE